MDSILQKFFIVPSNNIPVNGYTRSIIYDLQRNSYDFIPNELYTILKEFEKRKICEIYDAFDSSEHIVLDEYFCFLLEKEYILLLDTLEEVSLFPPINLSWDYPSFITNAVIDIGGKPIAFTHYQNVLNELNSLKCNFIQLRVFHRPSYFDELMETLNRLEFCIELILPFEQGRLLDDYKQVYTSYPHIHSIIVFDCNEKALLEYAEIEPKIVFIEDRIIGHDFCGQIHPSYFFVNVSLFTEGLSNNTCLNRKIGIDVEGEIKNCPSMDTSFGNIQNIGIKEVVFRDDFRSKWNITKDHITVCNICEFRYMCTDCRAYATSELGKPSKCTYDPITCVWN